MCRLLSPALFCLSIHFCLLICTQHTAHSLTFKSVIDHVLTEHSSNGCFEPSLHSSISRLLLSTHCTPCQGGGHVCVALRVHLAEGLDPTAGVVAEAGRGHPCLPQQCGSSGRAAPPRPGACSQLTVNDTDREHTGP